jgi:hypothetical protein
MADPVPAPWWGDFALSVDTRAYWRIGSFELWLERRARDWMVAWRREEAALSEALAVEVPTEREVPADAFQERVGFRQTEAQVRLMPAMADRPVVVSPEVPFSVGEGEEVTIYVSTPVWVQVHLGKPLRVDFEEPSYRLSDTWFGPSTREGTVCYAARTAARLNLENVPVRPNRAITAVRVRNRPRSPLPLEHLLLPMPSLGVYAAPGVGLWTATILMERGAEGDEARVRIGKAPLREGKAMQRLTSPREAGERSVLLRTFGGIFRRKE